MTVEIEVENPATGEIVGRVPELGADEVAAAVERGRAAQPAWEALGARGHARLLRRCRRWLVENGQRVLDRIVAENGKPHDDAMVELAYCITGFSFWTSRGPRYLADRRVRARSPFVLGRRLVARHVPVGVVGVIGPWNNPLLNSFGDAVPALAAGNAVVLKPSEHTPLSALLMAEMWRECGLPEHVYQVVTGRGATGQALVDLVDFVMFTGSTRTGRAVAQRAAASLTPFALELGGKDPLIVLEGADLERAANVALYGALHNGGQTCISIERAYVEAPIHDEFVARMTERFRRLRQGTSSGFGEVDVGAMTWAPQVDVVEAHVDDAIRHGARAVVGGHARRELGGGRFFEPTLLVDVDQSMRCMRDETFGPTLPVMRVRDAEEAVRLANDSAYGLQAAVFARTRAEGERIARRLQAGVVTVNDALINYFALELPMGGWKSSGVGVRHSAEGILKYTRSQAVLSTWLPLRRELHMMPFDRRSYERMRLLLRVLYGR